MQRLMLLEWHHRSRISKNTMTPHPSSSHPEHGFTMVVIAALFIAFAVIASVAVERNTTVQLITRRDNAAAQLSRLSNAIIEYAVFNGSGTSLVYPCPARLDLLTSDANFGKSVQTSEGYAQSCSNTAGDVVGPPVTTISGYIPVMGAVGSDVLRGMVPVQTLSGYGIGLNEAFDPWNSRIAYVVNRQLTAGGSKSQANNPTVADAVTGNAIPNPDFILISYGRDGVGAIKRGNTAVSIACTNGTATLRFENCDTDSAFVFAPTNTNAGTTGATYFDDIITYYRQ